MGMILIIYAITNVVCNTHQPYVPFPPIKGGTKKSIVDYVIENEGNLVKCKVGSVKVRAYCWAEQLLIKIV